MDPATLEIRRSRLLIRHPLEEAVPMNQEPSHRELSR
jgi:hypothetical protein